MLYHRRSHGASFGVYTTPTTEHVGAYLVEKLVERDVPGARGAFLGALSIPFAKAGPSSLCLGSGMRTASGVIAWGIAHPNNCATTSRLSEVS